MARTIDLDIELPVIVTPSEPQVQADWNQNDNTQPDFINNRICYEETSVSTLFNDDVAVVSMQQDDIYFYNGETALTDPFTIEIGKTYKVTKDDIEYEIVAAEYNGTVALIYGDIEQYVAGSFAIFTMQSFDDEILAVGGLSSNEVSNVSLKIETEIETVHQLDDKYISDNIARTSDIPAQAFELNESVYNIVSKFTNPTNTVTATASLIASAPSVGGASFGGNSNVIIAGNAASGNILAGASNIVISDTGGLSAAGSNNIVISAYGGGQSVSSSETASILIGGSGGVKLQNGGYQKTMIQPNYGAEINGDHSTIICGSGKIYGGNNTVFSSHSDSNEIYGANNIIAGGGNNFVAKIGDSSHQSNSGNSIVANANGTGTITDGVGNTIAFCQGGTFTISTGTTNTILGCNGSATISGGVSNAIISGYGNITIPATTVYTVVLGNPAGNSSFTASESNTVYMQNANASGILTLGTLKLKDDSGVLKVSDDGGTTWKTVTLS